MKDFRSSGKDVGGNEGNKCMYTYRLDTYGCGCAHDCKYCYAKSLLEFRGLWNPMHPAVGDTQKILRQVKKLQKGSFVRLGGMTDCFQPAEKLHRVTYKTIKMLNKYKVHYLIVTKSAMIADPEYIAVMNKELAHIQITVTTLDDALSATYEKASPPSKRIEAILKLQELGFDVQARISPYIPEYMDCEKMRSFGIKKAVVEFLRVNSWIKKWFDVDYSEYTVKQNGYNHLPLEKKKELIANIKGFKEITVCEDEDNAYMYWKHHLNPNPDDCCNLRR